MASFLFGYFRSFHIENQINYTIWGRHILKKHRCCTWDSNPGLQDCMHWRFHWAKYSGGRISFGSFPSSITSESILANESHFWPNFWNLFIVFRPLSNKGLEGNSSIKKLPKWKSCQKWERGNKNLRPWSQKMQKSCRWKMFKMLALTK